MSKLILTCELELRSGHSGRSGRSTVARMDWVPSYLGSRNGHAGSPGERWRFSLLSGRGIYGIDMANQCKLWQWMMENPIFEWKGVEETQNCL